MPRLSDVLGALLRDAVEAKVAADTHARHLSALLAEDQMAGAPSVPSARIVDLEFDLRFAIASVEGGAATSRADDAAARHAGIVAATAVGAAADRVHDLQGIAKDPGQLERLERTLRSPNFLSALGERIAALLRWHEAGTSGGKAVAGEVAGALSRTLDEALIGHPEVQALAQLGSRLLEDVRHDAHAAARKSLETVTTQLDAPAPSPALSLEVMVAADQLQALAPSAVSSLRIKVQVEDHEMSWASVQSGAAPRLVQEA